MSLISIQNHWWWRVLKYFEPLYTFYMIVCLFVCYIDFIEKIYLNLINHYSLWGGIVTVFVRVIKQNIFWQCSARSQLGLYFFLVLIQFVIDDCNLAALKKCQHIGKRIFAYYFGRQCIHHLITCSLIWSNLKRFFFCWCLWIPNCMTRQSSC